MTRASSYLLAILALVLFSCSAISEEEVMSSEEVKSENSYQFQEGELIHWEAIREGDFIVMKAWLNTDWNTYSVHNTNFLGPLPTLISFEKNEHYELVGEIEEEGLKTKFDQESESDIGYFKNLAIFKQKIKPISGEEFVLKGNVNYMICNATKCLPPADYSFELAIKP
ncbi:hypothetical protein [Parvicella tangerina]|uniref:Thiol:disulfide interchange protein DsbD N-terminal domain-containing protein n=1 Tax=Parvicella tangerina TaxID=2829795 RepID=A0A916JIT5_9FLAO|nr:hypothetical protein [Parvicella tangerina]CAG5076518.1 hypothetical protein CRYO30217_00127 [Parvicella tangerina]